MVCVNTSRSTPTSSTDSANHHQNALIASMLGFATVLGVIDVFCSDLQGFVDPPRVRGKGQKGKGQGKNFLTLNKPLTLLKGQGFSRGFSGVLFL